VGCCDCDCKYIVRPYCCRWIYRRIVNYTGKYRREWDGEYWEYIKRKPDKRKSRPVYHVLHVEKDSIMDITQVIIILGAFATAITAILTMIAKVTKPFREIIRRIEQIERLQARDFERFRAVAAREQLTMKGICQIYQHIEDGNGRDAISKAFRELLKEMAKEQTESDFQV
jgi:hypothetical protein